MLGATIAALLWANSPWSDSYQRLWEETYLGFDLGFLQVSKNLKHWVNDGLMAIFFFVIGLEVKHELRHGELSTARRAALPLTAALGGMLVPAGVYAALNWGSEGLSGWGVPMATDIAFALGLLALAGDRVPIAARVFLLALAAADDIGAILVIAVFYAQDVSFFALGVAVLLLAAMVGLRRLGVRDVKYYLACGVAVWLAVLESGVHATIAGVVLGLLTPSQPMFSRKRLAEGLERLASQIGEAVAGGREEEAEMLLGRLEALTIESESPLDRRMRLTHPWASFVILPLFALANAGVKITADAAAEAATSSTALGIVAGLVAGKLLGIWGFAYLAVRSGVAEMTKGLNWRHLAGISLTAGVGFTVSLFVAELAFADAELLKQAKIAILAASTVAAIGGWLVLRFAQPQTAPSS